MKPLFTPAKGGGRAGEDIALQIEAAIIEEKIRPGERLPSERELQVLFQTGRGVIREALRALKQKGLIEVRKGAKGGAFVKEVEVGNASESFSIFLKQQHIEPGHLIEMRESIDKTITTLAIARADKTEKQELLKQARKLQELNRSPYPDMGELSEADRNLNIRLARMSKNPIFEWIMRAVQQGFSSYDQALYEDTRYRKKTVENWQKTALEIYNNEPLKALSNIGNHYVLLAGCLQEKEEERIRQKKELLTEQTNTMED